VASLFMLGVLLALNAISPLDHPLAAAVRGGVIGGIAYLACFCLLPGGLSEIRSLVGDIRTAFARKGGKTGKLSQSSRAGSVGELVGSGPPP
jgi:hypothetical protein